MKTSYEMDMTSGSLPKKILLYAIPLMLSGILQLLFNAADIVVVGRFAGHESLAAVGSTSSLINLLVNVFIGFSVGANVLVARSYGAGKDQELSDTVHTTIWIALAGGIILILLGTALAGPLLSLMGTPPDVLDKAVLYMRIYFCGMPVFMLYNFGAAILRGVGDTRRPLYYLMIAGVINVALNFWFVVGLKLGVAGVALATMIAQAVSAVLVLSALMKTKGAYRFVPARLRINPRMLLQIARIGIPAGFQGAVFSVSNILIQSSINSFGSVAMAGSTAASNLEGFIYTSMNALYQTNLSFTSQNLGAGKFSRINKSLSCCLGIVTVVGLTMGIGAIVFGPGLIGIYSSDPEVIRYGMLRLSIICGAYFVCGWMDVMVGSLRGLGFSVAPMLVSLTGACLLRILWVYTVFQWSRTLPTLYYSYPVTWLVTAAAHFVFFWVIRKRFPQNDFAPTGAVQ